MINTEYGAPKNCYPFIITSMDSETPVKAWESFQVMVEKDFKWIRGYKYWRSVPTLDKYTDFDIVETYYRVRARCFSLEEKHDTFIEATTNEPYHLHAEDVYNDVAVFGLAELKEQK